MKNAPADRHDPIVFATYLAINQLLQPNASLDLSALFSDDLLATK